MPSNLRVFVLMAGLTALVVGAGQLIGGPTGFAVALLLAVAMNVFALFGASRFVLRAYRARVITEREAPELYRTIDRLRQRAGLPMPTVALAPHAQPNAFATGRSPAHAVVCVTAGLLQLMNQEELEGVIAHELAHVRNRDMLIQTVAATMAGVISHLATLAQFTLLFGGDEDGPSPLGTLAFLLVAPLAAILLQLGISRQREFKADAVAAEITGRPLALASALRRLDAAAHQIPMAVSPGVAPLAQVNPLAAHRGRGLSRLFSTHPPIAERVGRLESMAVRPAA
jgi:heat shock protein HtpX